MIRLWKHLMLLKRGGIGMLPGGANAAQQGSCAVHCPACPRDLPNFMENIVEVSAPGTNSRNDDSGDDDPDDQPPPLEPLE